MKLCVLTFLVIFITQVIAEDHRGPSVSSLKKILSSLRGVDESLGSDDSSDTESDKESVKVYLKKMADMERRYYKKKFLREMSEEEKSEVKYYDDLLAAVKALNN